ncbi:HD family hydrolase [Teratosphaeria destructans]|uniref:5'-deoxynucleotidase n=1 Tax=Teratosphaeria destructans TaxID=418781 RepID=A0A9W7VYL0_9PEZI|nr:HD family hydrolase [Teratosphaeria destructans]
MCASHILQHYLARPSTLTRPSLVLSALPSRPPSHSTSPIPFFHLLERLKTTKREGWRRFNITHGESISDHMYRMSIITMLCPPLLAQKLDIARCIRMALVHDMAESLVGDITPVDGVSKSEKSRREAATMDYLCQSLLGNVHTDSEQAKAIRDAWQEYEDSVTPESHFVHDVDKIELLLQMNEYERAQQGKVDLGEFSRVAKRIALPEVRVWAEELLREREQFWREQGRDASHVGISDEIKRQQDEYYRGAGKDGGGVNGHV